MPTGVSHLVLVIVFSFNFAFGSASRTVWDRDLGFVSRSGAFVLDVWRRILEAERIRKLRSSGGFTNLCALTKERKRLQVRQSRRA